MRLILADDHNLFREALCYYLRQCAEEIEILEASDLDGALLAAQRSKPDLILLDFVMPGMDGVKGIRRAKREFPKTPVVILSGNMSQSEVEEVLRSGAASVISKELSGDALRDALGRILDGERIIAAPRGSHPPSLIDIERFLYAAAEARRLGLALVRDGKGTASRTVGMLGAMFTHAMRHCMRSDNPVHGVMAFVR